MKNYKVKNNYINKFLMGAEAEKHKANLKERWRLINDEKIERKCITLINGQLKVNGVLHKWSQNVQDDQNNSNEYLQDISHSDSKSNSWLYGKQPHSSIPNLYIVNSRSLAKPHAVQHMLSDLRGYGIDIALVTETHFANSTALMDISSK